MQLVIHVPLEKKQVREKLKAQMDAECAPKFCEEKKKVIYTQKFQRIEKESMRMREAKRWGAMPLGENVGRYVVGEKQPPLLMAGVS